MIYTKNIWSLLNRNRDRKFYFVRHIETLAGQSLPCVFVFTYALSIFLTSTAFVSTNAKIRHTSFEIYRIAENCPLGYVPISSAAVFCIETKFQLFLHSTLQILSFVL